MNNELEGVYALWKRELIRFFRSKSRLVGSLGMPFFFLTILGMGLNNAFTVPTEGGYLQFIAPGIIGMILMFAGVFTGINVIVDRQFGFMKETLVAPVSRLSVVMGKSLGGATTAVIQGILIMIMAVLLGVHIQLVNIFLLLLFMFLISLMFVSLGVAIASMMTDMHGFQLIMNFLIMPMFFLSGALFPLSTAPDFLRVASSFVPLTYGVGGLRYLLSGVSEMNFSLAFLVVIGFNIAFILFAIRQFNRIEE